MIENNEIYVIMGNSYNSNYNNETDNSIIGYSDSEIKAKKFCDDKELSTGKCYVYNSIKNIDYILNTRPKNVTFKAFYEVSKDMITVNQISIIGQNKNYEPDWPTIEHDNENRNYFYFNMDIDNNSSKKKILDIAKNKADELLDFTYKNNTGFMYYINKQILLKEGIIEEDNH